MQKLIKVDQMPYTKANFCRHFSAEGLNLWLIPMRITWWLQLSILKPERESERESVGWSMKKIASLPASSIPVLMYFMTSRPTFQQKLVPHLETKVRNHPPCIYHDMISFSSSPTDFESIFEPLEFRAFPSASDFADLGPGVCDVADHAIRGNWTWHRGPGTLGTLKAHRIEFESEKITLWQSQQKRVARWWQGLVRGQYTTWWRGNLVGHGWGSWTKFKLWEMDRNGRGLSHWGWSWYLQTVFSQRCQIFAISKWPPRTFLLASQETPGESTAKYQGETTQGLFGGALWRNVCCEL